MFFPALRFAVNNLKLDQADNYSYYWWQKTDEDSSKSGAAGDTCHAHIHDLRGAYGERSRVTTSSCTPPHWGPEKLSFIVRSLTFRRWWGCSNSTRVLASEFVCAESSPLLMLPFRIPLTPLGPLWWGWEQPLLRKPPWTLPLIRAVPESVAYSTICPLISDPW